MREWCRDLLGLPALGPRFVQRVGSGRHVLVFAMSDATELLGRLSLQSARGRVSESSIWGGSGRTRQAAGAPGRIAPRIRSSAGPTVSSPQSRIGRPTPGA